MALTFQNQVAVAPHPIVEARGLTIALLFENLFPGCPLTHSPAAIFAVRKHAFSCAANIAADEANGIRAEDAGKAARSRTTATSGADTASPALLNSPVTKSLLEAVVGNVPLSDDYNITLSNTKFAPLARACLSSLFRDGDTGNLETKEKGVVVAHLHRELVGYQNAVETAANLFKNVELPSSAQKSLADNLVGAFDSDTRLFLEATIVYMFFTDHETSGAIDPDLKNLKKYAVDEFTLCDEHLVFEGKPVGQCFQKEYKATPFLARPSLAK